MPERVLEAGGDVIRGMKKGGGNVVQIDEVAEYGEGDAAVRIAEPAVAFERFGRTGDRGGGANDGPQRVQTSIRK